MTNQPLLSKREKEILKLVATGLTNREIAQNLHISPNTVKVHLSNIFEKTNVTSRTEAAFYGIEHGIIEVPSNEIVNSNGINWEILLGKFRWIWVAVALLSIVILVTFVTNVLIPAPTPEVEIDERWQKLAALPEPRTGMAAVAYHDEIFVFGGEGKDGVSGKVFRYSPLGDVWDRLNDKPT